MTLFATRLTMRTAFNGEEEHCGGRSSAGRAPDCDSGGRGFKPHRPPHLSPSFAKRLLVSQADLPAFFTK